MNSMKNLLRAAKRPKLNYPVRYLHATPYLTNMFLDCSPNAQLNKSISDRYMCLPIPEPKALVSYVWIDGTGLDLRMRTRTLDFVPSLYKDCPNWTFDGSSSLFACPVEKSDHYIVPIAMYRDPFSRGNNKIVLCETFTHEKKPTKTNRRQACIETLNRVCDQEVIFGFQQEFYLMGPGGKPFGWPCGTMPLGIGKNYAGIGTHRVSGREIIECVCRCCLYAGVDLYGSTAERVYSQWEILTGPTLSIKAADDLWVTRYIIQRIAEDYGLSATFRAAPPRSGAMSALHVTMSTKRTREDDGLRCLQEYIKKLEKNHEADLKHFDCGGGNHIKFRLTGRDRTCHISKFKSGVGDRSACVKISPAVADKKKGFFQDRRPSACADPYAVMGVLVKTCLL